MPVYVYRGMTDKGLVIKNKVEEESKQKLIAKLRENNITPIEITQVGLAALKKTKPRRNMMEAKKIFREVNIAQVSTKAENNSKSKPKTFEKARMYFELTKKITTRDIVIFSQDLYLLKKANFNNIVI